MSTIPLSGATAPTPPVRTITQVTRRRIADYLAMAGVAWAGRREEVDFLARVWDLASMPSYDSRFSTAAGDIRQHRWMNRDWDDDWVFTDPRFDLNGCDDEIFLKFLSEMVHPLVRDGEESNALVEELNKFLHVDGVRLVEMERISDQVVYGPQRSSAVHDPAAALRSPAHTMITDRRVLEGNLNRLRVSITADPPAAIGASKELVESVMKLILEAAEISYGNTDDIPRLYKKVAEYLDLTKASVPDDVRGSEASQRLLGQMAASVSSLADLRNQLGLGHGKTTPSPALERHARLAFNTAVAVIEFLLDTWHDRAKAARP